MNVLMRQSDLFQNIRKPKYPIILCHGLYGFDFRGPFLGLEIHYWATVLDILRKKIGADVIVRGVPGTGSIASRAKALHEFLCSDEAGVRGSKVNFVGHSMGGLDARYLISHLKPKPEEYIPVSCTSLSTPHRGSPFMDWCNANVGIGREYVEDCIREYEEQQGLRKQPSKQEEEEEKEAAKLPYSLKTPLFVRSKKLEKDGKAAQEGSSSTASSGARTSTVESDGKQASPETAQDQVAEAVQEVAQVVDQAKAKMEETGNDDKTGKRKSSLELVSPLTRALSSLSGSFSSYMLGVFDQPAYAMLSTRYMSKVFNPSTPNVPGVAYYSIAARTQKIPMWHPLWLPKVILDAAAEARTAGSERDGSAAALGNAKSQGNDGLVSVQSARWGHFMGVIDGCDHWDLRGGGAPRWGSDRKINPATGKPWKDAKNGSAAEESKKAHDSKETDTAATKQKKEDGWLTINRLLGSIVGSRSNKTEQTEAKTETGASPPSFTNAGTADTSKTNGQTNQSSESTAVEKQQADHPEFARTNNGNLVDEVASWISERLPEANEERRILADEAARKQAAGGIHFGSVVTPSKGTGTSVDGVATVWSGSDVSSSPSSGPSISPSPSSLPTAAPLPTSSEQPDQRARRRILKLRREADWLDSTGAQGDGYRARELRREIDWHREEWAKVQKATVVDQSRSQSPGGGDSAAAAASGAQPPEKKRVGIGKPGANEASGTSSSAAPNDASAEGANGSPKPSAPKISDKEQLERFWVALCQHLHDQGF
ncbi:unnamed protein product [Jaminaea pallidilutea]